MLPGETVVGTVTPDSVYREIAGTRPVSLWVRKK